MEKTWINNYQFAFLNCQIWLVGSFCCDHTDTLSWKIMISVALLWAAGALLAFYNENIKPLE